MASTENPQAAVPYEEIFYEQITPVYLASNTNYTLNESAGGGNTTATVTAGVYTQTTFATALQAALNTASFNHYTYTVTVLSPIAIFPLDTTKYASSYTIKNNAGGANTFTIA